MPPGRGRSAGCRILQLRAADAGLERADAAECARKPGALSGKHSGLARLCKTGAARGGCQAPAACLHVPWASVPGPQTMPCGDGRPPVGSGIAGSSPPWGCVPGSSPFCDSIRHVGLPLTAGSAIRG